MSASATLSDVAEPLHIALIGSPNSGKTTLFNALTGARAKVGNYPGVTVERREGEVRDIERPILLLDLPGTYSLNPETPDEEIVREILAGECPNEPIPDALVVVVDGTTLSRSLGLVAQVLHAQADQMRLKRRQRAEELARQASVKMVVVLVLFIFPVMFIVTVGPVIPRLVEFFQGMSGN